jgi:hypothetical protein
MDPSQLTDESIYNLTAFIEMLAEIDLAISA